jgi:CSLREA domain-containing protein
MLNSAMRALAVFVLLGVCISAQPARSAAAATISVTTTVDDVNTNGNCSLREAIRAANTDGKVDACPAGITGTDSITLPAGTYTLALAGGNEDAGLTGDLDITSSLTITGAGSGLTIIDGAQLDRVFQVMAGSVVILQNLTITGGHAPDGAGLIGTDGAAGQNGGGILNAGSLTLRYTAIAANRAGNGSNGSGSVACTGNNGFCTANGGAGGNGGGIYNTGSATLEHVTLLSNLSGAGGTGGSINCPGTNNICYAEGGGSGNGGGIASNNASASLGISSSHLENNITGTAGAGGSIGTCGSLSDCHAGGGNEGDGGGIFIVEGALTMQDTTVSNNLSRDRSGGAQCQLATCTILRSAFYGNLAGSYGGGILTDHGTTTLTNTTISNNLSKGDGGGLALMAGGGILNFVTVAYNTADSDINGAGDGGGIFNPGGTLLIKNSVVGDNTDTGGQAPDCSGLLTSQQYNHIENPAGCVFTATTGDVTGIDPGLTPLAYHDGGPFTHGLAPGSPLIDAIPEGVNTCGGAGVTTDQRLKRRPVDGNKDGTTACDKGAYEMWISLLMPLLVR